MEKMIIGLGGFGLNFLSTQNEQLKNNFALVAISNDSEALEHCKIDNKINIDGTDFESLEKYLKQVSSVVILNGLSGNSSKAIAPLITYLKTYNIDVQVVLTKPFDWEWDPKEREVISKETITQLESMSVHYKTFDNNELLKMAQGGMGVNEVFKQMDKQIYEYITQ